MKFQCRLVGFAVLLVAASAMDMNMGKNSRHGHVREEPVEVEQPAPMSPEQKALLKHQPKIDTDTLDPEEDIWFEKRMGLDYTTPDGETPIDVHIPALWGNKESERIPASVEALFAFMFIGMIACVPFVLTAFESSVVTRTQTIQSCALFIWLASGIFLFTQVIQFSSGHFRPDEVRSLTLVEYIYLIAQIITTVGYGDITPAYARGQVFIGFYVFVSILLIAEMVSTMAGIVMDRTKEYTKSLARNAIQRTERLSHHLVSRVRGTTSTADVADNQEEEEEVAPPSPRKDHEWLESAAPEVAYGQLAGSFSFFLFVGVAGMVFYHEYPGENKTWMEAIYMAVITLSTVGFGAVTATTECGKVFGAFWMIFGVGALGAVVSAFAQVTLQLKEKERWHPKKSFEEFKRVSAELGFSTSRSNVESVPHDLEASPKTIWKHDLDHFEFLKLGLLQSGSITKDDLERIEKSFQWLRPDRKDRVSVMKTEQMWTK